MPDALEGRAYEPHVAEAAFEQMLPRCNVRLVRGVELAQAGVYLLLGQRFTLDSYVFNNVTYDRVQNLQTGAKVERMLPSELDVQFGEDQATMRTGHAANNLAIVRHIVMNLLRLNTSRKGSIKTKRMLAATSDTFRAELLGFMT